MVKPKPNRVRARGQLCSTKPRRWREKEDKKDDGESPRRCGTSTVDLAELSLYLDGRLTRLNLLSKRHGIFQARLSWKSDARTLPQTQSQLRAAI